MLTGSELTTAITAVLMAAVLTGVLLHWFWSRITRKSDGMRLGEMAERLHEADLAREEAEAARREAETRLAEVEGGSSEKLAAMRSRLEGAVEGREAELATELTEAKRELEVMGDGLRSARQRIMDLESEIEALRGEAE